MAKRTEEYLAMIKATVRLTNAVKNELTPLSQELVARELISVDQGVELRNGNVGAVDRAANLVALVTNKVGQDRKNFYCFVEVLTDNRSVYKEILEDLQPIYKTGARAILTVRQPWYHKRLSREDAESKLGDGSTDSFLVRESTQEVGKLVLSIRSGDNFYHFPIERGVGSYQVEGTEEPFPSLVELIDYYVQHGLPESDSGELVIFKSPCICDASLNSKSSNGEVSTSSLHEPEISSSGYTYIGVTINERLAGLTSDVRPQHMAANRSPSPSATTSHVYEILESPEGRTIPPILPPEPHIPPPSKPPGAMVPIGDNIIWYWGNISSEEVARVLRDTPDGSFLVCDSPRTHEDYTLTVRKGGTNKHICIINKNGKFGFLNSEIISFSSVPELIEYYTVTPLTEYNPRLDITLSNPVSRFEAKPTGENWKCSPPPKPQPLPRMLRRPPSEILVSKPKPQQKPDQNASTVEAQQISQLVRTVKETMPYWYRPKFSRDEAINFLRSLDPGSFIVRDSSTVLGGYALAIKISPEHVRQRKKMPEDAPVTEDMLMTHFLIQPDPEGVKVTGWKERTFKTLPEFIAYHTVEKLCLPCKLVLPKSSAGSGGVPQVRRKPAGIRLALQTGAACELVYLGSVEVSGPGSESMVRETVEQLKTLGHSTMNIVTFKVSMNGIMLVDYINGTKRQYPLSSITYCGLDPNNTRWDFPNIQHVGKTISLSNKLCFGLVLQSLDATSYSCLVFTDLESVQPVADVVNFVQRAMRSKI